MKWIVYIVECSDKSLYTGIANDLKRRLNAHNKGLGAKYTKHRRPVVIRYGEAHDTQGAALTREAAIKSLDKKAKLALTSKQSSVIQMCE